MSFNKDENGYYPYPQLTAEEQNLATVKEQNLATAKEQNLATPKERELAAAKMFLEMLVSPIFRRVGG